MNRTIGSIIADVRTCINENADNEADMAIVTVDDSELDNLIQSKIAEAVDYIHGNADVSLMEEDTINYITFEDAPVNDDSAVEIELSEEGGHILRVVGGKLGSWRTMVGEIVSGLDTDRCNMIMAKHAGANSQRPAIVRKYGSGTYTLSMYRSARKDKDTLTIAYIARADKGSLVSDMGESENIDVDKNLYTAIVNYCAALVLITFGQTDKAKEMAELATVEIGVNSGEQNQ